MTNPYAPPSAAVEDVADPAAALVPANRGTRLGAVILDGVIGMCLVYVPIFLGLAAMPLGRRDSGVPIEIVVGLVGMCIGLAVWLYFTVVYVNANGQTIAKKWLNIKVVRSDGSRATLGRIFWLRNALNIVLSLIPLYGIIDSLFIFGESRQCLHDKIADTIVVNA